MRVATAKTAMKPKFLARPVDAEPACWQMGSWLGEGLASLDKKFCAGWQQVDHTQPCIDVTPDKGELFASNQRHHGWGKVGQCMFPPDDKWLNLPDKCCLAEQCSYQSSVQRSKIRSTLRDCKNCTQRCATPPSTQKKCPHDKDCRKWVCSDKLCKLCKLCLAVWVVCVSVYNVSG